MHYYLLTRNTNQARGLKRLIEQGGDKALIMPVISIRPTASPQTLRLIKKLDEFDVGIFISANAVEASMPLIKDFFPASGINKTKTLKIAAIGAATKDALTNWGVYTDIVPEKEYNSDNLLAAPELNAVDGKKIIIFKGEGGREILAKTLRARGARVADAITYRRLPADGDPSFARTMLQAKKITAALVMSNESLVNLIAIIGREFKQYLAAVRLVVISKRTAKLARELGFEQVVIAGPKPDDNLIYQKLKK